MTAILLTALFATAGLFAILTIVRSWHRYGAAAMGLREEFRNCSEWREVTVTIREVTVRPAGAVVLRPDFTGRRSPAPAHAYPAAA